jgi:hypothetical protein
MRCLTIIQPWASLVALGVKRVETRDWPPPPGLVGGRLAIHAAARWGDAQAAFARHPAVRAALAACGVDPDAPLPRGAVVGDVALVHAARYAALAPADRRAAAAAAWGDSSHGAWAWLLGDARRLSPPAPHKGSRGLWEWGGAERIA